MELACPRGRGGAVSRVYAHLVQKFLYSFERRFRGHRGLGPPARLPNRLPPPLNRFGPLILLVIVQKQRLVVIDVAIAVEAEAAGAEYRGRKPPKNVGGVFRVFCSGC